ncbi:MAG: hypothetical protein B6242_01305 [Anaerolineaceae bacterium 4572_78]|nr:MAG: hypothetical protein B6242_01305 [Anaerolineaceae bacterium 4572_78]
MQKPTNTRDIRRQNDKQLAIMVMVVLFVLGTGLIGLIWGWASAIGGALCLMSGVILIGGLWLLLSFIERLVED